LEEENEKMTEYEFFKMIGGGKRREGEGRDNGRKAR
jgi:hypothetical protein